MSRGGRETPHSEYRVHAGHLSPAQATYLEALPGHRPGGPVAAWAKSSGDGRSWVVSKQALYEMRRIA